RGRRGHKGARPHRRRRPWRTPLPPAQAQGASIYSLTSASARLSAGHFDDGNQVEKDHQGRKHPADDEIAYPATLRNIIIILLRHIRLPSGQGFQIGRASCREGG